MAAVGDYGALRRWSPEFLSCHASGLLSDASWEAWSVRAEPAWWCRPDDIILFGWFGCNSLVGDPSSHEEHRFVYVPVGLIVGGMKRSFNRWWPAFHHVGRACGEGFLQGHPRADQIHPADKAPAIPEIAGQAFSGVPGVFPFTLA